MDNIQITKDCIQTIANIGSNTYVNICNGTQNVVQWGTFDWILTDVMFLLFVILLGIFLKMIFDIWN